MVGCSKRRMNEEEEEEEEEEEGLNGHLPQIPNFSSWVCIIFGV